MTFNENQWQSMVSIWFYMVFDSLRWFCSYDFYFYLFIFMTFIWSCMVFNDCSWFYFIFYSFDLLLDDFWMILHGLKRFLKIFNADSSKFDENWCESMRANEKLWKTNQNCPPEKHKETWYQIQNPNHPLSTVSLLGD